MPGLFGYVDNNAQSRDDNVLKAMQNLLIYVDGYKSEPFYHENGVHAGYCAPSFETVDQHTALIDGIACWFDGEIHNVDGLTGISPSLPNTSSIKELIISAYKSGTLMDILKKADGYFSAVIYDTKNQQIKLITDRFGFKLLNYAIHNGKILWATECKALTAVPGFKISVDRQSVDDYMTYGTLYGGRTWLDGVCVLDQASVLTFDMRSGSVNKERYWSPDEIIPFTGKLDIREYCEEWGRLFKRAVAKRTDERERTGLFLSGGLDSRAILAAMPLPGDKINAVTFGRDGCDDGKFAAMAAKVKGANYQFFPLRIDGWFRKACLGVWATDGALNISSQMGIEHLAAFSKLFEVNMTGMGGGVMQGGMEPGAAVYNIYGAAKDGISGLHMRNRRFIRTGVRLDESFFRVRIPYYDNDLYSFAIAVPEHIRRKGFIINKALMHNFPEFYKSIPWQKTGVPISLPPLLIEAGSFYKRLLSRSKRKLQSYGFPVSDTRLFFNVSETMNAKDNQTLAANLLMDKNSFYHEYIPDTTATRAIHKYANLKVERKYRILTFEIWMRQLNDPVFREWTLNALNNID